MNNTDKSKLSKIVLDNFMSFQHLELDMPDEGILNVKGFNDSGKSALLIGVAVCLMDVYGKKQKTFIRDACSHFQVKCIFDDGVSILKQKWSDGSSLWEMRSGEGDLLYTTATEQGTRTMVDGVPLQIQAYLDMCSEEGFFLNFRRRTDKMMLVDTSGSENFKMLNAVLKSAELSEAASKASEQANKLTREISGLEAEYHVLEKELRELHVTEDFVKEFGTFVEDFGKVEVLKDVLGVCSTLLSESLTLPVEVFSEKLSQVPTLDTALLNMLDTLLSDSDSLTKEVGAKPEAYERIEAPLELDLLDFLIDDLKGIMSKGDLSAPLPSFDKDLLISRLVSSGTELLQLADEIHQLEKDMDKCPTCGKVI